MKMAVALAKQKFFRVSPRITEICVHLHYYFISCTLAVTWIPAFIVIGTSNHAVFDVEVQNSESQVTVIFPRGPFTE